MRNQLTLLRRFAVGILLAVLLLLAAQPAVSQSGEYELYGTAELSTDYAFLRSGEPEQVASGLAAATVNQRLYLPTGELFGRSRIELDDDDTLTHDLEEGYLRLFPSPAVTFSVGRQRINWGAGYTYSATDALHPQTAEAERNRGFDGLSAVWYASSDITVTGAVALEDAFRASQTAGSSAAEAWERLRYAGYASFYFGNLQLDGSLVYEPETVFRPGLSTSVTLGETLLSAEGGVEFQNQSLYPTESFDPVAAASAIAGGTRVPGIEAAAAREPYPILSGAAERSWSAGDLTVTAISEYLYNSPGYGEDEFDHLLALVDTLGVLSGGGDLLSAAATGGEEPFAGFSSLLGAGAPFDGAGYFGLLRRHYLFQTVSVSYARDWSSEHSVLLSLEDWGALFTHTLTLTRIERVDLGVEVSWTFAERGDEFALLPYEARTTARATVHY